MGLNTSPVWRGAKALVEDEDSPEVIQDGQILRITQTYSGPYAECMSNRPQPGSAVKGFSSANVVSTKVKRAPGGQGKLAVTSESKDLKQDGTEATNNAQAGTAQIEVEWARIDKPLASHSMFNGITSATFKEIEAAIQEGRTPTLAGSGTPAHAYYDKRIRGVDSYMVFAPVVRRTTPYAGPPSTSTAGKISSPPYSPGTFVYVKTGDRSVKQDGRWNRVEEWTGADSWDTDLYGP